MNCSTDYRYGFCKYRGMTQKGWKRLLRRCLLKKLALELIGFINYKKCIV